MEDTARVLEEMNVKDEDEITMCKLFDQYTRRGRSEGIKEGTKALISTCLEIGVSFDETAAKVRGKFSLGEEETGKNMQLYW